MFFTFLGVCCFWSSCDSLKIWKLMWKSIFQFYISKTVWKRQLVIGELANDHSYTARNTTKICFNVNMVKIKGEMLELSVERLHICECFGIRRDCNIFWQWWFQNHGSLCVKNWWSYSHSCKFTEPKYPTFACCFACFLMGWTRKITHSCKSTVCLQYFMRICPHSLMSQTFCFVTNAFIYFHSLGLKSKWISSCFPKDVKLDNHIAEILVKW